MKILVFIPTYNDHVLIRSLIEAVLDLGPEFYTLVIDDGSVPVLDKEDCQVERNVYFSCPYNVGLGVITNIALDYAYQENFNILIRIDADGQHPVASLKSLTAQILSSDSDIVIGVRSNNLGFGSLKDAIASILKVHMNKMANWVSGLELFEWHSGLMIFSDKAIKNLRNQKFERYPEIDILLSAIQCELTISQFEIVQFERKYGVSTISLLVGIQLVLRFYMSIIRFVIQRGLVK